MIAKEKSQQEYISRINRVMDYIETNIDQQLDLNTIAQIANFSPFHFHRIFTFLIGETPIDFIQRIRIEKAAMLIWNDQSLSVTEIAYICGFSSVSLFSRTFRKYFGITAREFSRTEKAVFSKDGLLFSKNGQLLSKNVKSRLELDSEFCNVEINKLIIMKTRIEVKEMPDMNVIYCRHIGAFDQIYKAYEKVIKWAIPRNLYDPEKTKTISVTHDDPSITDLGKVRQSACILIEGDVKVEGEIGKMIIPGGKYAVGHFELNNHEFQQAWNTMCLWFTESGYQQGEGNTYELYHNYYELHPEKKHIVDICIPVKPL
ncbi:MAG: AraC family transcriptional regulator [Prevotella sp.]|jgi:AraC family transcriptional regulator|nr:AraC family transcriptional regulator [Prevotella sp.]